MNNYIIKSENGEIITNPAERNIILLRYAAFLNENNDGNAMQQIQMQQMQQIHHQAASVAPQIQIAEQAIQTTQPKKSTKSSIQNAQANIAPNQKLSG